MREWIISLRNASMVVKASDQWAAWDTLKARPVEDFGLIVLAEPNENGNPIPVQTEALMRRWGRDADARAFHALAVRHGLTAVGERP